MSGTPMNPTTRLDLMLYAWLAEPDDRKFERAFKQYHDEAFSGLVKYLARRSASQDLDFEQMAVDALLRFFTRVGRGRREASEAIVRALPAIQAIDLGPFHIRQTRRWANEVGSFRETSMTFTLGEDDAARDWKAEIHSLAGKIPPLQRQGCHALNPLCAEAAILGWAAPADEEAESIDFSPVREFAARLKDDAQAGAAIELRHPGALRFVDGTCCVICVLPHLRVPTNGYLFDIAQSLYLDECKARNRQKRGGAGTSIAAADAATELTGSATHPLARIDLDDEDLQSEYARAGASALPASEVLAGAADAAVDPESEQVGEEFCEKFYAYLRRPLDAAEEAYRLAAANGPAHTERKRVDSLSKKIDRVIAVLSMRIEGQTQEAIAEALGVSRNQVKYIVEQVQEAYEQFATAGMRTRSLQATAGAISHVQ